MLTLQGLRSTTVALLAAAAMLVTGLAGVGGVSLAGARSHAGHHAHLPKPLKTPHEAAAIEAFAPDQSQFFCRSTVEPGVKAFERRVLAQYPVSQSDGDLRACDDGGTSEHKDGRAWDWGVDHRIPAQRAAGKSMLRWLFATDSHGNQDAMFRRLGLMYIIWDKRIWGAWSQHWEPYSCSGVTLCHVNHMHFSFGWAGAERKTSYWTHRVSPVLEPPLPVLAHGRRSLRLTGANDQITAHWLLKGGATYRITASGILHGHGKTASDAECTKTSHGWEPQGGVTIGGDQVQPGLAQWKPLYDNGQGCNTASHRYRLVLHQPARSTVGVARSDGPDTTISGAVTVSFRRTR